MTLRVLHVVQSLDPEWGGIAYVLRELAAGLARAGVTSRIATLAGGRFGAADDIAGVEVLRFTPGSGPLAGPLGCSREFDAAIPQLVEECDVVHLHGLWAGQNWSAGKAARRRGRPYIMTPHSMMMPWAWENAGWKKRPIGWLFEHRNLRGAARLHALAPGEADAIRSLNFNPRIETIPNGIWPADFANPPAAANLLSTHPHWNGKRLMLFLGRMSIQKGIVALLQACFEMADRFADWHLVMAGPDWRGMQRTLAAAVRRKGLAERVTFAGMLSRDEVRAALGMSELLVQPSLSEGLSMSILQALAAGRPVLISPACNMPEVQERGCGRVVAPDRRQIAAALGELMGMSCEALRDMGTRGQALVRERFNWELLLPRYVGMYETVSKGA